MIKESGFFSLGGKAPEEAQYEIVEDSADAGSNEAVDQGV
jgi:hypothetical protein